MWLRPALRERGVWRGWSGPGEGQARRFRQGSRPRADQEQDSQAGQEQASSRQTDSSGRGWPLCLLRLPVGRPACRGACRRPAILAPGLPTADLALPGRVGGPVVAWIVAGIADTGGSSPEKGWIPGGPEVNLRPPCWQGRQGAAGTDGGVP